MFEIIKTKRLKVNYDSISYMQIRGGSSKGIYFNKSDLPNDEKLRNEIILDIIGRDDRQIDGLGGANPLTSKVGIVGLSNKDDCDIDYLFIQVVVGENRVDILPNCGNILSGVGIFAIENNLIKANSPKTTIKVNMKNSNKICELVMDTPNGLLSKIGNSVIDGVDGTSAPIICNYLDIEGSICGKLFPSGNQKDTINGIDITCIDNGMPVVLINASDLGKTGNETCDELEKDNVFKEKLESIRLIAGKMMGLGDVSHKVIPKMSIISKPTNGGHISTRTFIPHKCHSSIGVLGASSVASACIYPDTITKDIYSLEFREHYEILIEHPKGKFNIEFNCEKINNKTKIIKTGVLRTARLLSKGIAYPLIQNKKVSYAT
jgi:4-oxalomesaconate tautomerase